MCVWVYIYASFAYLNDSIVVEEENNKYRTWRSNKVQFTL